MQQVDRVHATQPWQQSGVALGDNAVSGHCGGILLCRTLWKLTLSLHAHLDQVRRRCNSDGQGPCREAGSHLHVERHVPDVVFADV